MFINIFKPKEAKIREGHVVVGNSESGDTIIHIWKGDNIDTANSIKISNEQAIKLKNALVGKFGV